MQTKQSSGNSPRRQERGSAITEAVIVLPLVLLFIAGCIQLSYVYLVHAHLELAVARAARAAAVWVPLDLDDEGPGEIRLGKNAGPKGHRVRRAAALALVPVAPAMSQVLRGDIEAVMEASGMDDLFPVNPMDSEQEESGEDEGNWLGALLGYVDRWAYVQSALELDLGSRPAGGEVEWMDCKDGCFFEPGEDLMVRARFRLPLFLPGVGALMTGGSFVVPRARLSSTATLPSEDLAVPIADEEFCTW